jgi:hypothetical protein
MANGTGTADEERGTTMPRPGNRFARLRRTAACAVLVALLATGYVPWTPPKTSMTSMTSSDGLGLVHFRLQGHEAGPQPRNAAVVATNRSASSSHG